MGHKENDTRELLLSLGIKKVLKVVDLPEGYITTTPEIYDKIKGTYENGRDAEGNADST